MSRRSLLCLLCLLLISLTFLQLTSARGEFKVNEARTRVLLQNNPVEVQLAVENSLTEITSATVRLELLDPRDGVASRIERTVSIGIGKHAVSLSLPFDLTKLPAQELQYLPWYRLRYNITDAQPAAKIVAAGIISLSQITPDLFSIRVAATEMVHEGMKYRARIQAIHPVTRKPAAGVRVDGVVTLETDDAGNGVKLPASGVTDSTGYVVLSFAVPARFPEYPHETRPSGGSIHVIAQRGALVVEAENNVLVDQFPLIVISTDKPIYQPGQVLHVRALALSPTRHVLPDQTVNFRVLDPDSILVFKDSIKSTRFGVSSVDWPIPENMRLGDYLVQVSLGSGEDSDSTLTTVGVRISRYDLPNFSVTVKPDHTYYLSQQNAEVRVSADYLFGQPVTRGKVRVVRETEREWNYREQKWDIEEGDKYEGETDANGVFTAHVDLSNDHKNLADEDYQRFRDVTYAAYFTDLTTNRTEQRRFDLRVTRDPIHVYVIRADNSYYANNKLPLQFYVSTFYADGSPAECKVTITDVTDAEDEHDTKAVGRTLATVRSNRYGLAKIADLHLPDSDVELKLSARDAQGKKGSETEKFSIDDSDQLRMETDKSLYRPGDPILLAISSSVSDLTAVVDITREASVLSSQRVHLHGGRASITIPYKSEFKDKLTIAAYADFAEAQSMISTRTILFPRDQDLKVEAHAGAKNYRPGDEARFDLRIRGPRGEPAEAALGLVIVDKAVDERYRTDQEFGSRANGFYGSLGRIFGFDEQISGITLRDFQRLDMTKPVSPELDLAAEVLLKQSGNYYPVFFNSDSYETSQVKVFSNAIKVQLVAVVAALNARYLKDGQYPRTDSSLKTLLLNAGVDIGQYRDPWGDTYHASFTIDNQSDVLSFFSAGADKQFGTDDDFVAESMRWEYFRPIGIVIDEAVRQYHKRTGEFIRDFATLRSEVAKAGLDLDSLRDRWGELYRFDFDIAKTSFVINLWSGGPNKTFTPGDSYYGDDFRIWNSTIDYFAERRMQIDNVLNAELKKNQNLPQTDTALSTALANSNIDLAALKDPWGTRFYSTFKIHSFYGDRVTIESRMKYGEAAQTRTNIKPTTLNAGVVELRSAGADRKEGTEDDFDVATFSGIFSEQTSQDATPKAPAQTIGLLDNAGGIFGVVTDQNDATVAGARISATNSQTSQTFETTSDDEGLYLLRNLPAGNYEFLVEATGFKRAVITGIPVASANVTELNIKIEPGAVTETVTVTSAAEDMQTTQASLGSLQVSGQQLSTMSSRGRSKVNIITKSGTNADLVSTPRLREYFPETLLWQPLLETDNSGRAQVKFKLADNITTWRMSVIGSTANGQIGTADTEIKSFQPFFVEHDPPRVLTEGDQISLPIVVRNYLERAQAVDLEIKPESWFKLLGPARQRANVAAGDAARQTFELKAVASVKDGKQRVTATSPEANDAIEKPVTVHPDGEEKSQTTSDLFDDTASLKIALPASVIAGSTQAELKIYPNLMAHVVESVEGILERPHGCGEQTISSTYPSILILRHNKQQAIDSGVGNRAQRYAELGYQRLLNYRSEDGGFTYWGRGDADLALTAYALRFLHDAREFVSVDEDVIKDAREWLIKQQRPDGSWVAHYYSSRPNENQRQTALTTAFVARVLAVTEHSHVIEPATTRQPSTETVSAELRRALSYLSTKSEEIDEPYLIASYALAAIDAGDLSAAARATTRLRALAHSEADTTYWALETNTPFYGWGLAGRVETSALAVQALARFATTQPGKAGPTTEPLVRGGLLFLLRKKDRYGVWYSTQATINVLDTIVTLLAADEPSRNRKAAEATVPVEIIVNGKLIASVDLPRGDQAAALVRTDISRFLQSGANRVELRRPAGAAFASAQLVTNYYVSWPEATATQTTGLQTGGSSSLRLTTTFDKNTASINEEISCHVKAERFGFSGYGMLLAEIGLPPGADVDRASLETAMKASDWAFSQYDVLPDRVVVYLWPRAGGIDFDFKFRPRFALTAKAAPAVVYDYYNPDARAVVAPATFVIR
jgi:uncharacterized protein YfaS (alpha-2-macroglobulin family)